MYNSLIMEDRIISLIKPLNLSKNKLLQNAGLSKSVFDNLKKGQIPSVAIVQKIADYLDCSVDYLLGRTDNIKAHKAGTIKQETSTNIVEIPLAISSLSAGTGNLLLSDSYELTDLDRNKYPKADLAFKVKGDSMEPRYKDGDIVYIHKQPTLDIGDTGAFLYNDEQYIKQLTCSNDVYKLHSFNENYQDIEITDNIIIYGKVIN